MKSFFCVLGIVFFSYTSSANAAPSGPAVGTIAPDFKVHNLVTREEVSLSSQHGKVVILTFWASWCPPCKRELPMLEGAQRLVGKDKLVVMAVSYRDTEAALNALKRPAANWQINLMTDRTSQVAKLYSVSSIPHLFMIGRDGKIIANHLGYGDSSLEELVADINSALAAPVSQDQGM